MAVVEVGNDAPEQNPMKAIDININGTTNMLAMAAKLDIPFILISTQSL